jgi:hypothetical protein
MAEDAGESSEELKIPEASDDFRGLNLLPGRVTPCAPRSSQGTADCEHYLYRRALGSALRPAYTAFLPSNCSMRSN